ncbi:hypothetical protein PsorP6_016915 [Peronosclerospora sorghi]|uniref:Uncharacterized protein n=1 Tax=Peronosclerospora sorghi TaxID=230839 RepID=A0ACC0WDQ1_9STRA|nr:hypothetical protein PsorP6_016915 [Peronosclerospora sorghi]
MMHITLVSMKSNAGRKRGRLLRKPGCAHFRETHALKWNESKAASIAADVAWLQRSVLDPVTGMQLSDEMYRCVSCTFRGVREASREKLQEIKDGEDDGTFMAHAILENHHIAVLERKGKLYCARCRDFIYPDAAREDDNRRCKQPFRGVVPPHKLLRRGLVNMGNTCFMSSVLQALARNPMLQHYFFVAKRHDTTICQQRRQKILAKQHKQLEDEKQNERYDENQGGKEDTKRGGPIIAVCLGCELAAFMASLVPPAMHLPNSSLVAPPIAPQGILEAMWNVLPSFIGTAQHDAHELLVALLGGLHSQTHPRVFVRGSASPRFTPRGHSLCDCAVHQHFSGVMRSEVSCGGCGTASHKFDPFLDVSLSLNGEKSGARNDRRLPTSTSTSLASLLRQFSAKEELRGSNQVYCRRCSKYQNNFKSLNLHTLPNVLVFHIRRLDFYRQQKLLQNVKFPLLGLNMRPFTSVGIDEANDSTQDDTKSDDRIEDLLYDLVAVVNHHGDSVNGGHYTCYVRDEVATDASNVSDTKHSEWILYDDVDVKTVAADEVERSQAYVRTHVLCIVCHD